MQMVKLRAMPVAEFLKNGGKIKRCPTVNNQADRDKIDAHRPPPQEKIDPDVKTLSEHLCANCIRDNGKTGKRCLKCKHYRQFRKEFDVRDQMAFDYLPEYLKLHIAATPDPKINDRIKQLPLSRSVPLMMQYCLDANLREIALFLKISPQMVDKRNKKTIRILKTLITLRNILVD
jgi:hypothetical protein